MKGVTVAGSIFLDRVSEIEAYPREGMLAKCNRQRKSVGGCVGNTASGLKAIDPSLDVYAECAVGEDESGDFVISECAARGLDVSGVVRRGVTGTVDAYYAVRDKTRTFFTYAGANAAFSEVRAVTEYVHIGYVMLLDYLDGEDPEYGTRLARLAAELRGRGKKVGIDAVSSDSPLFPAAVRAAAKYCDLVILNEIEGGRAFGIDPRRPDGRIREAGLREIAEGFVANGAGTAVIHCPEGAVAATASETAALLSLDVPKADIRGTVGAGDMFCAGVWYGTINGMTLTEILSAATACAAAKITGSDCAYRAAQALNKKYGRRSCW